MAQSGSAPALGAGGPGFESRRPDWLGQPSGTFHGPSLASRLAGPGPAPAAGPLLTVLLIPWPALAAQQTPAESLLWNLPLDRVADLLSLEPGVATTADRNLILRGGAPGALNAYLDGVPVAPGRRGLEPPLLGGSYPGAAGAGIGPGVTGLDSLGVEPGVRSLEWSGGLSGVLRARTFDLWDRPLGPSGWTARVCYGTDAVFGREGGLDLHRIEALATGRAGRFAARTPRVPVQLRQPSRWTAL